MRWVRGSAAILAAAVIVLAAPVPARAAPLATRADPAVGASVHGRIIGQADIYDGKFPVDLKIIYRASQVSQASAPGYVNLQIVAIDVLDPSGNASSKLSVTYQRFEDFPPVPMPFGELNPFDADQTRAIRVTAAADAAPGTWHIRGRVVAWTWDSPFPGTFSQTIQETDDSFAMVVHAVDAPAPPSTATRPAGGSGGGSGAGGQQVPVATSSPDATSPAPTDSPGAIGASPPGGQTDAGADASAQPGTGGGLTWLVVALAVVVGAAVGGGLTLTGLRLNARRKAQ
jgi:hypothetical protein